MGTSPRANLQRMRDMTVAKAKSRAPRRACDTLPAVAAEERKKGIKRKRPRLQSRKSELLLCAPLSGARWSSSDVFIKVIKRVTSASAILQVRERNRTQAPRLQPQVRV
jgi:hypothetical protein